MIKQPQPSQSVNKLGKYLYKNLDGAFKLDISPNTADVYVTVLYQVIIQPKMTPEQAMEVINHYKQYKRVQKSPRDTEAFELALESLKLAAAIEAGRPEVYPETQEMTLDLNITTYANKIRINIIEMEPDEKTISFDTYEAFRFADPEVAKVVIERLVRRRISKEFEEYEFLF